MSSQFKTNRLHSRLMSRVLERWHWALLLICLCFGSYFGLRASTDTTSPVRSGPVASATAPAQPQTKSIEEIQAGDLVMARDDVTGEVAPKRVAQVFRNTSDHLRILTIRNANGITQEIQTTNEHPFYVPDSGWTSAGELTPGTKLLQMDEQLGVVVSTRCEEHPEGMPVFNFEVEDYHTYYVADQPARGPPSGLLAHNTCTKYTVGAYNGIKGKVAGLDAHHVGQKALMKKFVRGYDPKIAPSILVPKVGHTIKGPKGIVSRSTKGLNSARDVTARDIKELRRVYGDVPRSQLKELIQMNKNLYPTAMLK